MSNQTPLIASLFAACLASVGSACADTSARDASSAGDRKAEEYYLQGHSPADAKSMMLMQDKTMKTHKAGEPVVHDPSEDGKEYYIEGHSPADAKSMARMQDKEMKTHKIGEPVAHASQPCEEVYAAGHLPADAKSMMLMRDKTMKTRKIGDCDAAKAVGPESRPGQK